MTTSSFEISSSGLTIVGVKVSSTSPVASFSFSWFILSVGSTERAWLEKVAVVLVQRPKYLVEYGRRVTDQ